jgi:hypothetical protein
VFDNQRDPVGSDSLLWTIVGVVLIAVTTACSSDGAATPGPIGDVRGALLALVGDVTKSDGHRYSVTDDRGHELDTAKIIEIGPDQFAAVYHWWTEQRGFTVSLATSSDLLHWAWRVDLGEQASMPTIREASDGGYVVAWEQEPPSQDNSHLHFGYYRMWDDLAAGAVAKVYDAERQLSDCAEGTPNLYAASSTHLEFGFHYFANCHIDLQGRGTSNWTTWTAREEPLLVRAAAFQGYRGSIGDRDTITFDGHLFTFLEAQFLLGDWRTFRVLLYDDELGAADRANFPDRPSEPPSMHVTIWTHNGSSSLTNLTIGQVTLHQRPAIVIAVFVPGENQNNEAGELIYYRFLNGTDSE